MNSDFKRQQITFSHSTRERPLAESGSSSLVTRRAACGSWKMVMNVGVRCWLTTKCNQELRLCNLSPVIKSAIISIFSTLDSQPLSLRHRGDDTIETETIKTHAVSC